MRFLLIDRIEELIPGERIVAVKNLSIAEEYLEDHFPGFPVMPGVLMLEGMTQAAAWLVRASEDFAHSVVVLKDVKAVKYGRFVEPGQTLRIVAEALEPNADLSQFRTQGFVADRVCVTARLTLERYNLAGMVAGGEYLDRHIVEKLRVIYRQLRGELPRNGRPGNIASPLPTG